MLSFGERIHVMRRRRGMTQAALASAVGMNSNFLARVERGDVKDVAGQLVAKLAQALGCSTDYLLGLADDTDEEAA